MSTFGKDMQPAALVDLLKSEIHRPLINSITSGNRDDLTHAEKVLVPPGGEDDIVSAQRPSHSKSIPEETMRHYGS